MPFEVVRSWKDLVYRRWMSSHGVEAPSPISMALLSDEDLPFEGSTGQYCSNSVSTLGCCTTGAGACTYHNQTIGCCGSHSCN